MELPEVRRADARETLLHRPIGTRSEGSISTEMARLP
jgi:hypothetical protein